MSHASIAAKWVAKCKKLMKLQDWTIELTATDDPPSWCDNNDDLIGQSVINIPRKTAKIWVSPKRATADDKEGRTELYNIGSTVVHEMLHVLFDDVGIPQADSSEAVHGIVYTLETMLMDGGIK